MMKKQKKKI